MVLSSGFPKNICVRGAREHNLKNIDVTIPRDVLVAFTGVSGSGKSSLAFGTIYAEAQRRYFESVAPYARRLIDQVGVPDVDSIEGLPPAVALAQSRGGVNVRSSVGSVTAISSAVRLLYSRAGSYPSDQPMLYAEDFSPNTVQGACVNCHGIGKVYDVTEESVIADPSLTIRDRAIAAWPTAWHGKQLRDILISLGYDVDIPWRDMPRDQRDWILFTDETPQVPVFTDLSPQQVPVAIAQGKEPSYVGTFVGVKRYVLETFAHSQSASMRKRASQFMVVSVCPVCQGKRLKPEALSVKFEGLDITEMTHLPLNQVKELLLPVTRENWVPIDSYVDAVLPDESIRKASIAARVNAGGSAHDAAADIRRTKNFSEEKYISARRLAHELLERIEPIISLGLGYVSLDRATPTLSSGELQRIRLATQLLSQLFGVVFVLDEPSAGLHPADREALLKILHKLKNHGNTVFVVEHALEVIRACDWIVDIGPFAGSKGGQVVYSGELQGIKNIPHSLTSKYLYPNTQASVRKKHRRKPREWLQLNDIQCNNLKNLTTAFPIGCLTAVTGVSGSGKTSLVSQALPELVYTHILGTTKPNPLAEEESPEENLLITDDTIIDIRGKISCPPQTIRRLVQVNQKPIGRTPRSNIATYTGVFDLIRKLFANTPQSRQRHYTASRFSFNIAQGRCHVCKGEGSLSVELLFLPTVYAPCQACAGTRYNPQTLEIQWKEHNIADILALTIDDACAFFSEEKDIHRYLIALHDVGLGYLSLGQRATELSGGEAQRVKLATELQRTQRSNTLYILDEPTAGLHPADTDKLMHHLHTLVDMGNTVILVEHDMRVVADVDWVIDLGPGAGDNGGTIVVQGTPDQIIKNPHSLTATYLKPELHKTNLS